MILASIFLARTQLPGTWLLGVSTLVVGFVVLCTFHNNPSSAVFLPSPTSNRENSSTSCLWLCGCFRILRKRQWQRHTLCEVREEVHSEVQHSAMSAQLSEARERMSSGFGLVVIDDHLEDEFVKKQPALGETITTKLTSELSPSVSACEGEERVEQERAGGVLTRTLSALQRLSLEEQTTLRLKLGAQQQSSRDINTTSDGSSSSVTKDQKDQESSSKGEDIAVGAPAADSPYRVVLQKAVVESDLEAATAALMSGADPNERDELCHSSLHFAAAKGDIECLRELMRSGARANVANNVSLSLLSFVPHLFCVTVCVHEWFVWFRFLFHRDMSNSQQPI